MHFYEALDAHVYICLSCIAVRCNQQSQVYTKILCSEAITKTSPLQMTEQH